MEIPDKGLFATMYDAKMSYLSKGVRIKIYVYCENEDELKSAVEIAKHYKTDFSRVSTSTTTHIAKNKEKTKIEKKTYSQFLEFCIREIEWMK